MRILNQTRKTVIANETVIPISKLDQSLGLLKYKTPIAMLFKTRFGIHTFAMRYPIDVLIIDQSNQIATIKENLSPNQIYLWNPEHNIVLELPPGTIKKSKTKSGDKIQIK